MHPPHGTPFPPSPAPSPPPQTPKPKKQQFQTDQNRPFLFPFSARAPERIVPYAIEEADRLYGKHVYIGVSNIQTYAVRDEAMREESGLERLSERQDTFTEAPFLDVKIEECNAALRIKSSTDNRALSFRLSQRREDLLRLKRVDLLYVR
jgi:hypothetical protein